MIQKKIKKWYPTEEREREAITEVITEEGRRPSLLSRYGHGNYIIVSPELATALSNINTGTYSHLGGAQTTRWNDPNPVVFDSNGKQQNNKKSNWKLFKEDFGKWCWANFMMSFCIMSVTALIYSLLHYLLGEPIKIDKIPLPYYKELGFTLIFYYLISSIFWVLSKLWRIKAYISSTIKLIIYCMWILPISVIQKSSISDKINNYLLDKFCTKKEKIIIENIIK